MSKPASAKKEEFPPALRKWLEKSLSGLTTAQVTQGQRELKTLLKMLMDEKLMWSINWEMEPLHIVGDTPGTLERLKLSASSKPGKEKTVSETAPPVVHYTDHFARHHSVSTSPSLGSNGPIFATAAPQFPHSAHTTHPMFQSSTSAATFTRSIASQPPPSYGQTQFAQPQPPPEMYASQHAQFSMTPSPYWQNAQSAGGFQTNSRQPTMLTGRDRPSRFSNAPVDESSHRNGHSQPKLGESDAIRTSDSIPPNNNNQGSERNKRLQKDDTLEFEERRRQQFQFASEMSNAMREYMESNEVQRIKLAALVGKVYKVHPELKAMAYAGGAKAAVLLLGSGMKLIEGSDRQVGDDDVELISKKRLKKKIKVAASTSSSTNGDESPSKRAARAARFGQDVNSAPLGPSTYEKINQESMKVAAALERAERLGKEVDWSSLVIKGTCMTWEKPFLRLTAPPDASTVRPEPVLKIALENIMTRLSTDGKQAYSWACDQFKSIRQDMKVQHIENAFTVEVYETHARAALQYGKPDYQEFNLSCTQLHDLYEMGLGSDKSKQEFAAYLLLYHVYCKARYLSPASVVTLSLCRPKDIHDLSDPAAHALSVYLAIENNLWRRFFMLYDKAPGLGKDLLRPLLTYARLVALKSSCTGAKTVPKDYLMRSLRLESDELSELCLKFKLVSTSDETSIDAKPSIQAINEAFGEGLLWS